MMALELDTSYVCIIVLIQLQKGEYLSKCIVWLCFMAYSKLIQESYLIKDTQNKLFVFPCVFNALLLRKDSLVLVLSLKQIIVL